MHSGIRLPMDPAPQLGNGNVEFQMNVHAVNRMPFLGAVKRNWADGKIRRNVDDWGMDTWPQRSRYRDILKAFCAREGRTQEWVADQLGLSLSHFRNSLYRPEKRLGVDALSKSAGLFGCSVAEFVDDPGASPAGIDLSNESPLNRFWFNRMIQALSDSILTDDDRAILFEDLMRDTERRIAEKRKIEKK